MTSTAEDRTQNLMTNKPQSLQEAIAATMSKPSETISEATGNMRDGSYFLSLIEDVQSGQFEWLENKHEVQGAVKILKELYHRTSRR